MSPKKQPKSEVVPVRAKSALAEKPARPDKAPIIRFERVAKHYPGKVEALNGISFMVRDEEFVSLVGPSGAGKSTIVKLLIREETPTAGKIFVGEDEVTALREIDLPYLRRKIGIVFQDFKLLNEKTAFENIAFAMEMCGYLTKEIHEDVPRILKIVGLSEKAHSFPNELSGGEKQRVAIARALIHRPDIIVADEPTGNLDPINTIEIARLLVKINELGTTVILATHNKDIVNALNRRVITLKDGVIVRDEEHGRFVI